MEKTDQNSVFLDETKLESRAGRYTLVWRKREEKQLSKVKEQVQGSTGCTSKEQLRAWLEETVQGISYAQRSGRGKSQEQKIEAPVHAAGDVEGKRTFSGCHGKESEQLLQNRAGCHLHAYERGSYAQRANESGI